MTPPIPKEDNSSFHFNPIYILDLKLIISFVRPYPAWAAQGGRSTLAAEGGAEGSSFPRTDMYGVIAVIRDISRSV